MKFTYVTSFGIFTLPKQYIWAPKLFQICFRHIYRKSYFRVILLFSFQFIHINVWQKRNQTFTMKFSVIWFLETHPKMWKSMMICHFFYLKKLLTKKVIDLKFETDEDSLLCDDTFSFWKKIVHARISREKCYQLTPCL